MTDTTNPRAAMDAALWGMRYAKRTSGHPGRITMEATVACAEALSLLVDAHLATVKPEPEPEPEPDPREGLPNNAPVGHGWLMGWDGWHLYKPNGLGLLTWWVEGLRQWGTQGEWHESELDDPSPATVGDLRRLGVPVTEWPDITAPEPDPMEPPDVSVVLVDDQALQRVLNRWYPAGEEKGLTWAEVCSLGEPTVIYKPKEAP